MPQAQGTVVHNENANQFELQLPGGLAVLQYRRTPDGMDLIHTKVPAKDEGAGHGTTLVSAAIEHARRSKQRIIPTCPFVKAYFEKHPEDRELALTP